MTVETRTVSFTAMKDGTREDYALLEEIEGFEAPTGEARLAREYAPRKAKPGQVHGHNEIVQWLEKAPQRR